MFVVCGDELVGDSERRYERLCDCETFEFAQSRRSEKGIEKRIVVSTEGDQHIVAWHLPELLHYGDGVCHNGEIDETAV